MSEKHETYKRLENLKKLVADKSWLRGMFENDIHKAEVAHLKAEINEAKEEQHRNSRWGLGVED